MSADRIITALATLIQARRQDDPDLYMDGADGKATWLAALDNWKTVLRDQGPAQFTYLVQYELSRYPDRTCELLNQLYADLGLDERTATWDDFEDILDDPTN